MGLPELRPRHPLAGVAIAAVIGIVVADRIPLPLPWLLVAIGILALVALARPASGIVWLLAAAAFGALHTVQYHGSTARAFAESLATPRVGTVTGIAWSEPERPATWSPRYSCHFLIKVESIEIDGARRPADFLVTARWTGSVPDYGDRVQITGGLENLGAVRNPGQFDFARYQQRRGIYTEIRARYEADCVVRSHGHGSRLQVFAQTARSWIRDRLELDLFDSPEIGALIESMVLGLRGETPEEMRELFQRTGTMHLFAVSGLNIAMLAAIAMFLLRPLGVRRKLAVCVVIPLLGFYALVTGLSPSCVRAAIMGAIVLAAQLVDRPGVACNSLSAAGLAILAWDTNQLFVPGFQFSFALVFVIVALSGRIERRCAGLLQPDPFVPRPLWSVPVRAGVWTWRHLSTALGVTIAAWLGSLLFTAGYFHLFSISALLANLLAIPLAFVILALGFGSVVCGAIWSHGAVLFNNANWLAAKALLALVHVFAAVPGGHFYVELPSRDPRPDCEWTVLDVADGAAIHLRAGGEDWLIDSGSTVAFSRIVLPYLRTRGVNRLDGFIVTHGDSHHVGGALGVLTELSPARILDSAARDRSPLRRGFQTELERRGLGKSVSWRGDRIALGESARLRILYPPPALKRSVADDKALVIQLECGGRRVLLMSDSGFATEHWLVENEPDLRSDVLVKGHHTRDLSGTPDFLLRVQPAVAICSDTGFRSVAGNLDEWEAEAAARGISVFRQDRCGAVRGAIRDGELEVSAFARDQTFRNRAR